MRLIRHICPMKNDPRNKRFPAALSDQLSRALHGIRDLEPGLAMELLARFRRNRVRLIASIGASMLQAGSSQKPPADMEMIPPEYLASIERLDDAFQAFHRYRTGGAEEYVARDVFKTVQGLLSAGRTSAKREQIAEYLIKEGYPTSKNKKAIKLNAAEIFKCSERTVEFVITQIRRKKNRRNEP